MGEWQALPSLSTARSGVPCWQFWWGAWHLAHHTLVSLSWEPLWADEKLGHSMSFQDSIMRSENWVYHFHTLSIFWVWEMSLGHLSGFAASEAAAGVLFGQLYVAGGQDGPGLTLSCLSGGCNVGLGWRWNRCYLGTSWNYCELCSFILIYILCIGPDVPVTAWLCKCAHCMLSGNWAVSQILGT